MWKRIVWIEECGTNVNQIKHLILLAQIITYESRIKFSRCTDARVNCISVQLCCEP